MLLFSWTRSLVVAEMRAVQIVESLCADCLMGAPLCAPMGAPIGAKMKGNVPLLTLVFRIKDNYEFLDRMSQLKGLSSDTSHAGARMNCGAHDHSVCESTTSLCLVFSKACWHRVWRAFKVLWLLLTKTVRASKAPLKRVRCTTSIKGGNESLHLIKQ